MDALSVVVPVFNEAECLPELNRRILASIEGITSDFEVIYVDDGGTDGSWGIIEALAGADSRIRGLRLSRNFGKHHAVTAGLDAASGERVALLDADLQDRPEDLPKLYAKALEGFDVVLSRRTARHDPFFRRLTSAAFYRVFDFLAGSKSDPLTGSMRLLSRRAVDALSELREQFRFPRGMLEWIGFPTATVDVHHDERFAGSTTFTFSRLMSLALGGIVSFTDRPLKIAVVAGSAISALAFMAGLYFLIRRLVFEYIVSGWTSMMVSVFFLGGLILLHQGIIGLYLARVFAETKKRPLYIVMDRVNVQNGTRIDWSHPMG